MEIDGNNDACGRDIWKQIMKWCWMDEPNKYERVKFGLLALREILIFWFRTHFQNIRISKIHMGAEQPECPSYSNLFIWYSDSKSQFTQ